MIRRRRADRKVGALLRALPVPEHADDFFDKLRASLVSETDSDEMSDSADSAIIDLSIRRTDPSRRGRLQNGLRTAAAPAAAVACFALVVGVGVMVANRDLTDEPGPDVAASAKVAEADDPSRLVVARPYQPAKTGLRVKFETETTESGKQSYEAVISPTGDYHLERAYPPVSVNFSVASGSRSMYNAEANKPAQPPTFGDLPAGPPELTDVYDPTGRLSRDLGAAVRALAAEKSPMVRAATWDGGDALELVDELGDRRTFQGQRLVVDAKTGIPVLLEQTKADGSLLRRLDVLEIEEAPIDAASLAPALPPGAISSESRQFGPSTIADAAKAVQYRPLVPTWAPAGYELAQVALAPQMARVQKQSNPTYADVIALVYRKGLDSFTITTRRAAIVGSPSWVNPFTDGNSLPDRSVAASVEQGELAGSRVRLGIYPLVWPHVWAQRADGVLVTIAGDLNREQLLKITESLRPFTP